MIRKVLSAKNTDFTETGQGNILVLSFSVKGMTIMIIPEGEKTVLALDEYVFDTHDPESSYIQEAFNQLFKEFVFGYSNVSQYHVIINTLTYTPVPSELFKENETASLMNFVQEQNEYQAHDLMTEMISNGIWLIYQNVQWQKLMVEKLIPDCTVHNNTVLFAQSVMKDQSELTATYVFVCENYFDVLILENRKLLLLNRFSFTTSKDFCYYLIGSLKSSGLNPSDSIIFLAGEILPESEIISLLRRYVSDVRFAECSGIQFPEEMIPHRYFTQFALL